MKRNMDLVRQILIEIECSENGNLNFDALRYEREQVCLHVQLMKEQGLVDAAIISDDDGPEHEIIICKVEGLTWDGHDFLDKVFTAQNTGFPGRSSVWLKFTASEGESHSPMVLFQTVIPVKEGI